MPDRTAPYPAYNYLINRKSREIPQNHSAGYSDVSGLNAEFTLPITATETKRKRTCADRRFVYSGGEGDVQAGRREFVSGSLGLGKQAQTQGVGAQRDVTITFRDEGGNPLQIYKLFNVTPSKLAGPTSPVKAAATSRWRSLSLRLKTCRSCPLHEPHRLREPAPRSHRGIRRVPTSRSSSASCASPRRCSPRALHQSLRNGCRARAG